MVRKRSVVYNRHHKIPRSRGGGNGDNVILVPEKQHRAYHKLFGNRTPEEIIDYILDLRLETPEQEQAWQCLFGNKGKLYALSYLNVHWFNKRRKRVVA